MAASVDRVRARPPLERMLKIHSIIQSGSFPSAPEMARQLEVCSKSIHRDLEFMRDRLQMPVEFDKHRQGFYYTQEVRNFPTLQITEGELLALVVAEKALQQYRGTSFEKPLLSAIRKMEQSLPDTVSLDLADAARAISFRTSAEPILNLGTFQVLAEATGARQQIKILYRKPGQSAGEERVIDPYHLANVNGEWFLFAYDHLRKDIRTFVPARMQRVERTGKTFERRRGFSLEQRLRDSFGVHSGDSSFEVVLRFAPEVADYIREKKWHDSQKLRDLKGGAVELRMQLSGLEEVERWVLSWGGKARVMKPPELARRVAVAARAILKTASRA